VWASACFWTRWGARCAGLTSGLLDTHTVVSAAVAAMARGHIICTLRGEPDVFAAWLCAVDAAVVVVVGCRRNVGAVKQSIQTRVGGADWLQHRCPCRPLLIAVELRVPARPDVPRLAQSALSAAVADLKSSHHAPKFETRLYPSPDAHVAVTQISLISLGDRITKESSQSQ